MLKSIPNVQTGDRNQNQLQSNILSQLNILIKNPLVNGNLLQDIELLSGSNVVNHKLNRKLIGWYIVRQRSAGTVYDTQDSNTTPELNLLLTASANMSVDLYVF